MNAINASKNECKARIKLNDKDLLTILIDDLKYAMNVLSSWRLFHTKPILQLFQNLNEKVKAVLD